MSYTCPIYHLMTSTKHRRPLIAPEFLPRLTAYLGGMLKTLGGEPIEINGPEDHIHIVASMKPTVALSAAMKDLKANCSGWVHKTFPELRSFGWQDGYAGFTVSPSVLPRLRRYVRNQQEHHKKVSFIEELKWLLNRHGIKYEDRYLA